MKFVLQIILFGIGLVIFNNAFSWNKKIIVLEKNDSIKRAIANSIKKEDLKAHLQIISSNEFEGRETGTRGQKLAAEYIANSFERFNIEPIDNSIHKINGYYQEYRLLKKEPLGISISVGNRKFRPFHDFYYFPRSLSDTNMVFEKIKFLGYGIKDSIYNDYAGVKIQEKELCIILEDEPLNKKSELFISGNGLPSIKARNKMKIEEARSQGVNCLFVVVDDIGKRIDDYKGHLLKPTLTLADEIKTDRELNCFYISREMADYILDLPTIKTNISYLENRIKRKNKPQSQTFITNQKVSLKMNRKKEIITSENILGFIEGEEKKEEIIILTAHYDHLGIKDSLIYNGADDDGSGTVAILELAEAFSQAKKLGYGPKRSILFMPVSGEEKGLLGSRHYTEHPVFPLKNTIANLNIDMIGRVDTNHKDNPNYVYIIGADRLSKELHDINESANSKYGGIELDYRYNERDDPNRFYYRSDHFNFAKNNIPVIFYFTGVHEDYHKHTDTIEKIDFDKMEKIVKLIYYTTWELANRENRIKLDKEGN